jgi:hypothetical protein
MNELDEYLREGNLEGDQETIEFDNEEELEELTSTKIVNEQNSKEEK